MAIRLLPFGVDVSTHQTRRQLYDLIWPHEMPQVAEHLGISEWQIRQCQTAAIPNRLAMK